MRATPAQTGGAEYAPFGAPFLNRPAAAWAAWKASATHDGGPMWFDQALVGPQVKHRHTEVGEVGLSILVLLRCRAHELVTDGFAARLHRVVHPRSISQSLVETI